MAHPNLSAIDDWLTAAWTKMPKRYHWLLLQTLATREDRRAWIHRWRLAPGWLVVDVGCGPGVMAHEIAAIHGFRVLGLDRDASLLAVARDLNRALACASVSFQHGDIYDALPPSPVADFAVARFLAQYASDCNRLRLKHFVLSLWQ
jgi:ubiquinone/menaquinone biosynthesis C-methylase UbiE